MYDINLILGTAHSRKIIFYTLNHSAYSKSERPFRNTISIVKRI